MGTKWHVVSASQLDDPGDADEIDPGLEVEASDDGGSGDDQNFELRNGFRQRMRDRAAALDVPQSETVMAVNQDTLRGTGNVKPLEAGRGARTPIISWRHGS